MGSVKNIIGKRYGRLVVLEYCGSSMWKCLCDCGNVVNVRTNSLTGTRINTRSCGCLHKDKVTKHGRHKTRIYRIWGEMRSRCHNPQNDNYNSYGGRGIKICNEWADFKKFYLWSVENGYSDKLTLDRIDVNGDYSPQNCRWATSKQQANNRRNNHYMSLNGQTKTVTEWANEYGIVPTTLLSRLRKGIQLEVALTMPLDIAQSKRSLKRKLSV